MGKTSKWEKNIWKTRRTEWEHKGSAKIKKKKWMINFLLFFFFFFAKAYITELTAIFINNVREHLFFKTCGLINNLYLHSTEMISTGIWNPTRPKLSILSTNLLLVLVPVLVKSTTINLVTRARSPRISLDFFTILKGSRCDQF